MTSLAVTQRFFLHRESSSFTDSDDVLRVVYQSPDAVVVALANAFDSGFATHWPPGSRYVLDVFERTWREVAESDKDAGVGGLGSIIDRARRVFHRSAQAFIEHAEVLHCAGADVGEQSDPGDSHDVFAASLTVVVVSHKVIHSLFRGGAAAVLIRGGRLVRKLPVHTLHNECLYHDPKQNVSAVPDVLTAVIDKGGFLPDEVIWPVEAGDAVWVLSRYASPARGAMLADETWPDSDAVATLLATSNASHVAGIRIALPEP